MGFGATDQGTDSREEGERVRWGEAIEGDAEVGVFAGDEGKKAAAEGGGVGGGAGGVGLGKVGHF